MAIPDVGLKELSSAGRTYPDNAFLVTVAGQNRHHQTITRCCSHVDPPVAADLPVWLAC